MEWAATKSKIINMSLGSPISDEGTDPMALAVNRITEQTGALFVVAAGNYGRPVGSPASADAALTVGAVDREDKLAAFSSRGPRLANNAIKPDITAPGVDIVAAKAKNARIGTPVGDAHLSMSGTSMATPHVAGAAAILAAKNPTWKGEDIKAALMNSAKPNPSLSAYEQGAGRLDVGRAVSSAVSTDHGSFSLGTALWPHDDDKPITQKLTYRNNGTSEVTIDLSVADVKPAANGLFSVSPGKLTIPAGGTADATVTADTKASVPDDLYSAAVVSSGGTRTMIGVHKEVESYDVKMTFLDHDGKPTTDHSYQFVDVNQPKSYNRSLRADTLVQRLPKGTFFLQGRINTPSADPTKLPLTTLLTEPALEVNGNVDLVLDAREGVEPSIQVEQEVAPVSAELVFDLQTNWGTTSSTLLLKSLAVMRVRPSKTSSPKFRFAAQTVLAKPDGAATSSAARTSTTCGSPRTAACPRTSSAP